MSKITQTPLLSLRSIHFRHCACADTTSSNEQSQCQLEDINFELHAGEKVALVGQNGSGKSTLLLLTCGCLKPQSGSVWLQGENCTAKPELARQHLGKLFQDPDHQLFMPTVREELLCAMPHQQQTTDDYLANIMGDFKLKHLAERAPHNLSVGEKKRVALASLLMSKPKLLLLDEASAGLDPRSRRQLINTLIALPNALLLATHDLEMALEVANKVVVLDAGRIVGESSTPGLLADKHFMEKHGLELPISLERNLKR